MGVVVFGLDDSGGRVKEVVQVGCSDDRLAKVRDETDGIQSLDEVPLCSNEVVAEYVDFLRLFFALFVELLCQQAQSSMSLFIVHDYSSFLILRRNLPLIQG
jgi:hypothetical protein